MAHNYLIINAIPSCPLEINAVRAMTQCFRQLKIMSFTYIILLFTLTTLIEKDTIECRESKEVNNNDNNKTYKTENKVDAKFFKF